MPVAFDRAACARRNQTACRRDAIDASPFRFLRDRESFGRLPGFATKQARGEAALTEQFGTEVYIHYLEAASDRFVPDRFMFLHTSTLQNIAADAEAGIAFMNSHHTGGLSHPAELPFGKSFLGHYDTTPDETGRPLQRALMGVYLLPGLFPSGNAGPSTDDLNALIASRTVSDVSVGLWGGAAVCDVCGADLDAFDEESGVWLCPHLPGTTHRMSEGEVKSQTGKGVTGGAASYSLFDSRCGEVSAVYDGAIPGAGFLKFARLERSDQLPDPQARRQVARVYAPFLTDRERARLLPSSDAPERSSDVRSKGDTSMSEDHSSLLSAIKEGFASLKDRLAPANNTPVPDPPPVQLVGTHVNPEVEALKAQLAAAQTAANEAVIDGLIAQFKVRPSDRDNVLALRAASPEAFDRMAATMAVLPELAPPATTVPGDEVAANAPKLDISSASIYARRARETAAAVNGTGPHL